MKKILKLQNAIIVGLLAFLGFSCIFGGMEYGTPSATFIINGKVSDKETQQPIENIRIADTFYTPEQTWRTPTYTNGSGNYEIIYYGFPKDEAFHLRFHDTLGRYVDLDTLIEFKDPKFTGGNGKWYSGKATKTIDIQLTPKEHENKN